MERAGWIRSLGALMGLFAHVGLAAFAQAENAPVIDGVPQPIPVDERIVLFDSLPYWRDAMRDAAAGKCELILSRIAAARPGDGVSYVHAKAQLLDHGLCLSFDPAAAFAEIATLEPYFPGIVALWRGWKSYYGHGLPKSDDASVLQQDFLRYLLSITWRSLDSDDPSPERTVAGLDARILSDLGARPIPPMLEEGILWLKAQLSDRAGRLNLARAMLWGDGTYSDGTPLPDALSGGDADMFVTTLSFLYAEANVLKATALLQGLISDRHPEGWEVQHLLQKAADCLNHDAILLMIRLNNTGALPGGYTQDKSEYLTLRYVMLARALNMSEDAIRTALDGQTIENENYMEVQINSLLQRKSCTLL